MKELVLNTCLQPRDIDSTNGREKGRATVALRLSDALTLPAEAVTETFAILGKRGSGKTSTAVVLVEELVAAGELGATSDQVMALGVALDFVLDAYADAAEVSA